MKKRSGNKRQYDIFFRKTLAAICALGLFFTLGFFYGERETMNSVRLADEARCQAGVSIISWQQTTVDARIKECERMIEDLLFEEEILEIGLRDLFRNIHHQPNLLIRWNQERIPSWTYVLVYNEANLPKNFTEKNRPFILRHNAKKGDVAMFLGEKDGVVKVFFLTGDFAGKIGTFEPTRRFDRQGAFVCREIGIAA